MKQRLLWQLYIPQLLCIIGAIIAVTVAFSQTMHGFFLDETTRELESKTRLAALQIGDAMMTGNERRLGTLGRELSLLASARLTVVLPDGRVVADSDENPARMENHGTRQEIQTALAGHTGIAQRMSKTLARRMLYVATPIHKNGTVAGVVRLSLPVTAFEEAITFVYWKIAGAAVIIILIAALIALSLSRRVIRPLEEIEQGLAGFASGDYDRRICFRDKEPVSLEISLLADTINRMAAQLGERIRTITQQHNELEAVFTGMVEAVLVINADGSLARINRAATDLLDMKPWVIELGNTIDNINEPSLRRFIDKVQARTESVEEEISLAADDGPRHLQAYGAALYDGEHNQTGSMIVLHDVTRLKRLEKVRQDFVANVSHELKTPITAIKGFVETLLDGALDDHDNALHFLEIVSRQTNRLDRIIEDLLTLSRLEKDEADQEIIVAPCRVGDIIQASFDACASMAAAKRINFSILGDMPNSLNANAPLLEQAVTNLLTNAIKYSNEDGQLRVNVWQDDRSTEISVQDWGCGIGAEHLPRLFERFYRSDKARSRALGGTGLGLAIVKHIAKLHHGDISVKSRPGKGSTFTIRLPKRSVA